MSIEASKVFELRLRTSGMFSIVNEVIQYLHLAEINDYRFLIDWRHSCYFEKARGAEPWEYYFEPCFVGVQRSDSKGLLPVGKAIACAKDNIITPRLRDGQCNPLLLPHDRAIPHHLINKYLHLKPYVLDIINTFERAHFADVTIGLHLRGLGRNHGGAHLLRAQGNSGSGIDYERFFKPINEALIKHPKAKILVCSDSQSVVDHVLDVYGTRVITYDASRSDFGEMHANHVKNQGLTFSPYKLGLDIIVEAYLLARTNYFVHGNSNVANFVISLNKELVSNYVYADLAVN